MQKNHAELVRFYDHYDSIAMESSKIYRSSMYLRSILPFFAMLAIAIGTYVDIIGDKIAKYTFCDISIWSLLAALGFFVHAILNLYAWRMAKNNRLTHARSNFVSSRFIAEYLRVLIHGEAYAIQLDTVCMDTPLVKKNVLAKLHHILRSLEQLNYIQTSEEIQISAEKFLEFVKNQQTYHNSTCNRYKKISQDLTKWSTHLFFLSFFIVLSNSIIQCGLAIFLSENWKLAGIIFDFLSLLIPAWASYFSTKLTLNNFDWLYQNSADMLKGYKRIENDLVKIIEDKKHNSCQIMNDIANDIMGLCQSDFTNWYLRTDSQTFTPL